MSLPLAPYTVIDLTRARSGPTCVRQLAEMGAKVIKVESREQDDFTRDEFDFQNLHRNKRSITLDLKHPKGVEVLKKATPPDYIEEVLSGPKTPIPGFPAEEGEGGAPADPEADELYDEAVRIVTTERKPSISYVQRRLKIGYVSPDLRDHLLQIRLVLAPARFGELQLRRVNRPRC